MRIALRTHTAQHMCSMGKQFPISLNWPTIHWHGVVLERLPESVLRIYISPANRTFSPNEADYTQQCRVAGAGVVAGRYHTHTRSTVELVLLIYNRVHSCSCIKNNEMRSINYIHHISALQNYSRVNTGMLIKKFIIGNIKQSTYTHIVVI